MTDQPARGDRRRSALLESLDHYLREGSLDSINIADISRRAGVTRSAFYFYFENKASAVAALMEENQGELVYWIMRETGGNEPQGGFEGQMVGNILHRSAGRCTEPQGLVLPGDVGRLSLARRGPRGGGRVGSEGLRRPGRRSGGSNRPGRAAAGRSCGCARRAAH